MKYTTALSVLALLFVSDVDAHRIRTTDRIRMFTTGKDIAVEEVETAMSAMENAADDD